MTIPQSVWEHLPKDWRCSSCGNTNRDQLYLINLNTDVLVVCEKVVADGLPCNNPILRIPHTSVIRHTPPDPLGR